MRHTVRQNSPVVVVGAGPAGLTAAITLARAGIETLVIEKRPAPSRHPRATGVSTATMELLRSWGLEEHALAAAMDVEWRALATPTLADAASGTPVEVGFPTREQSAVVSPTGPACIPQDELERVMEEHLASLPAARIERGVEVIGVDSRDDGVTVAVRNGSGIRTLRARYLDRRRRHPQHGPRRARHPHPRPRPRRRQPRHPLPRPAVGGRRRAPPRHLLRRRGRQEGRAPGRPARPLDGRPQRPGAAGRRARGPRGRRRARTSSRRSRTSPPSSTRSSSPSASASAARSWSATPRTASARAGRRG